MQRKKRSAGRRVLTQVHSCAGSQRDCDLKVGSTKIECHRKHLNRCSTVGTTKKTMTFGARRKRLNRHNETTKCRENYGPSIKSEPTHSGAAHGGPRTHGGEAVGGGLWGPLSASSACTPTGDVGCSKNTNAKVMRHKMGTVAKI